jgi:hypothetical protein
MGLRTSADQLVGSVLGGVFGTLGAMLALPHAVGVPVAVGLAILSTHSIGFHRGTVAAAFTALFLQLVSFGDPLHTFGYRLEAVGIAALSAFVVNVAASSLFYEALFAKRLRRLRQHIDTLLYRAAEHGPAELVVAFPFITELALQLRQATRELRWRGNAQAEARLAEVAAKVDWLQDLVHLAVNLEYSLSSTDPDLRKFLAWLPEQEGPAPSMPQPAAQTRDRILALLDAGENRGVQAA